MKTNREGEIESEEIRHLTTPQLQRLVLSEQLKTARLQAVAAKAQTDYYTMILQQTAPPRLPHVAGVGADAGEYTITENQTFTNL